MKNNINKSFPHKYTKDFYGKDILLGYDEKLKGYYHQIMMKWEIPYMKKCIEKLNTFGDVLKIDFGISTLEINHIFNIKSFSYS